MSRAEKVSKSASCAVIIMAAGQGKRMRSTLPKVLHSVAGRPLLHQTLHAVLDAAPQAKIAVIVGHGRELVEASVLNVPRFAQASISFIVQSEQKGTGHAVSCAMNSTWGKKLRDEKLPTLVLPGDLPLVPSALIAQMTESLPRNAKLRLLTTELEDPSGYGRIVRRGRGSRGAVLRIVEEKDASQSERAIREVGASIYLFQATFLAVGLGRLSPRNAQGEYYLTDLVAQASKSTGGVDVLRWAAPEDLRGVNDPWELALAQKILNRRLVQKWAQAGVQFEDLDSVTIGADVLLAEEVKVGPGVVLKGFTRVERGAELASSVVLTATRVGERAKVKVGTVAEDSEIGVEAQVGPYAHLRPGSHLGPRVKVGNFVEIKKTTLGEKTSVAHLSYLGDAVVGSRVNIGCGFVTCNYDGTSKHQTVIEDDVFMGSDCQVIAPLTVGKGAYIASGSTLTQNVEPGALAIARSRQVTKSGYARRFRKSESRE